MYGPAALRNRIVLGLRKSLICIRPVQADKKKAKADEKAYQDALKRIPDPKEKYDPWGMTKIPDAVKKPSK
jgi:hypothetical protein